MPSDAPDVRILRSADRFVSRGVGTVSRHCFSFGEHYDPDNVGFGNLIAVNDETLSLGAEFAEHPHAGIDVVTWVVQGRVEHSDSTGRSGLSSPGVVQILGSGDGIRHRARNVGDGVCRLVQCWLRSADSATSYEQIDVSGDLARGGVVPLVDRADSRLYGGLLGAGSDATLPAHDLVHVFVVSGALTLDQYGVLEQGDSARLTSVRPLEVRAGRSGADLLVWGLAAD